jgi:catalase
MAPQPRDHAIIDRQLAHFDQVDAAYGAGVRKALGIG